MSAPASETPDSPHERRPALPGKGCAIGCLGLIGAVVLPVVVLTVMSMCGSDSGSSRASKYTQTWPKAYDRTTCDEWSGEMSGRQKWAAAADMLTAARNKGDGGTGLPGDSLITEFQGAVTTACVVPTMSITEVGVGIYLTEPRFRP